MQVRAIQMRYKHGTSDKFYTAYTTREGPGLVHWGRVGTRGQAQLISTPEALERVGQKRASGYNVILDQRFEHNGDWNQHALADSLAFAAVSSKTSSFAPPSHEQEYVFEW